MALTISLIRSIPHMSYLVVLIGIPSLAVIGGLCTWVRCTRSETYRVWSLWMGYLSSHADNESLYRILRKTVTRGRSHQRVSAEVAWTFALLPFEFSTFFTSPMSVLLPISLGCG
jgi:hypothetical protein